MKTVGNNRGIILEIMKYIKMESSINEIRKVRKLKTCCILFKCHQCSFRLIYCINLYFIGYVVLQIIDYYNFVCVIIKKLLCL